jgi:hypothetical protein
MFLKSKQKVFFLFRKNRDCEDTIKRKKKYCQFFKNKIWLFYFSWTKLFQRSFNIKMDSIGSSIYRDVYFDIRASFKWVAINLKRIWKRIRSWEILRKASNDKLNIMRTLVILLGSDRKLAKEICLLFVRSFG